jgi:glycosyltransferase involved in cell wall biosynthesis
MPLKVAEAFAHATPVVISSGPTGGFPISSGEQAIVADDPADAAEAVAELLRRPRFRARLGLAGHRWAVDNISEQAVWSTVQRDSVIASRINEGRPET